MTDPSKLPTISSTYVYPMAFMETVYIYNYIYILCITYGPHKAVAEVSKDKEPIGRGCVECKWFESQLMSDSSEVRFKRFGCQMI